MTVSQSPIAGSALTNGANPVVITASDNCGNMQSCTTTVNFLNDLLVPENYLLENTVLYPNPVTDELTIESFLPSGAVSIDVYDMFGKLLIHTDEQNAGIFTINMKHVKSGMYHVIITGLNTQTARRISKI